MLDNSKSVLLILVLIISILGPGQIGFGAPGLDFGASAETRSSRIEHNGYHWGGLNVTSEVIPGMNGNTGLSVDCNIATEDGKIYVVWEDYSNYNGCGNDGEIFFRFYDGKNWSDVQVISEPVEGSNLNTQWSGEPAIAVEDGNIYVVWSDQNNTDGAGSGDVDIFYRTNLTGKGWARTVVISEPVFGQNQNTQLSSAPDIAVENAKVYVVWQDRNNTNGSGTDYDIFYITNQTGSSWEPVQVISEPKSGANINIGDSFAPHLAVENGNVHVVWYDMNNTNGKGTDSDIFYLTRPESGSWQPLEIVSEPVPGKNLNVEISINPSIQIDLGSVYIVWEDRNDTNGAGNLDTDIFFRARPAGLMWEDVQVISEPQTGKNLNTGSDSNPAIDVEGGSIVVVWESQNQTNNCGTDRDIFYLLNLTGNDWEQVQVISEPVSHSNTNTGQSFAPGLDVNMAKSHVVWYDNTDMYGSGGDFDIFYRATFVAPVLTMGTVTPVTGNTSTVFNFSAVYHDGDNELPLVMNVTIDGLDHSMLESNRSDINAVDGKEYYYSTRLNIAANHTYRFRASDGSYTTATTITDAPDVFNTAPGLITQNVLSAVEDVYYEVDYDYDDIDEVNVGQKLVWDFSTNASWLKFNLTNGVLNGTPLNEDTGTCYVNISINDTFTEAKTHFEITVLPVNDPPRILTADVLSAFEDLLYEVDYEAEDVDSDQLQLYWDLLTNASWLNLNHLTGVLKGKPNDKLLGSYWVNVSVNDSEAEDYTNFTLAVSNTNDPPVIITSDVDFARIGELYEVHYQAMDIDSPQNALSWYLNTNVGPWLSIARTGGWLNGTPNAANIGIYWVNVTVSDGSGGTDSTNFTLTVAYSPPDLNKDPEITTEDVKTAWVGVLYSVDYNATDDHTPVSELKWAYATNASWLSFNTLTGLLSGIPAEHHVGEYWVNINVSDGEGGIATHLFTLTVRKPLPPPKNTKPALTDGDMTPEEGDTDTVFVFSVHYYDKDGDPPTVVQVVIDGIVYNMTLKSGQNASNGIYEFRIQLGPGKHEYYFKASDGIDDAVSGDGTPISDDDAFTTTDIKKPGEKHANESLIVSIMIVIIIIIVLGMTWMMRTRRPVDEEVALAQPPSGVEGAEVPEGATPEPAPTEGAVAEQAEGEGTAAGVAEPVEIGAKPTTEVGAAAEGEAAAEIAPAEPEAEKPPISEPGPAPPAPETPAPTSPAPPAPTTTTAAPAATAAAAPAAAAPKGDVTKPAADTAAAPAKPSAKPKPETPTGKKQ